MGAISSVVQTLFFLFAAAAGGTVLGWKYGPWQGALLTVSLFATLILAGAVRTQHEIERTAHAPRPHLKFWETQIKEADWVSGAGTEAAGSVSSSATYLRHGRYRFGRVLVVNEPPSEIIGEDARSLGARIIFLGMKSGHTLGIEGRWSGTTQAPERSVFSGDLNVPIDLPANGRPRALDVVMQTPSDGACFAFNDENGMGDARLAEHRLRDPEYKVVITLRASNSAEIHTGFRLFTGSAEEPMRFIHERDIDL